MILKRLIVMLVRRNSGVQRCRRAGKTAFLSPSDRELIADGIKSLQALYIERSGLYSSTVWWKSANGPACEP